MIEAITRLWSTGTAGKPARLKRQIALSNQLGLFGAAVTLPYQIFYLLYDISLYLPIFSINLLFIAGYLAAIWINGAGRHTLARNIVFANACVQILVVTYFISAGAGVHLFYFTVGNVIALIFFRHRSLVFIPLLVLVGVLFMVSQFAFPVGSAVLPVPEGYLNLMYAFSALGTLMLTGTFSHLYRVGIDRAEDELTRANRDLERLSATDQLTSLSNRRSLDDFLEAEWARMRREQGPLSILMCDVDCFKAYNDHYGHQAGDESLRRIAAALRDVVRRPSDMVARYGGEEFAVILPHTDEQGAQRVGEQIRHAVEELAIAHEYSEVGRSVTISVGASTFVPDIDLPAEELLRKADEALYAAKTKGRNCVDFQAILVGFNTTGSV